MKIEVALAFLDVLSQIGVSHLMLKNRDVLTMALFALRHDILEESPEFQYDSFLLT